MRKTFQVALTKSFLVTIEAESEKIALEFAEIFTSDIQDLSSIEDRIENNFSIQEIITTYNQSHEITEL